MTTTVQVERGRWRYLDAYLTLAGVGVSGIASSTPVVTYKKYGDLFFTEKVVDLATSPPSSTVALATSISDTEITLADTSDFPPSNFYIDIDTGFGNQELNVLVLDNNLTTNTLTVPALASVHSIGEAVILQRWREIATGPPVVVGAPDGYYSILFNASDLDTLDIFVYSVTGAGFDDFTRTVDIIPRVGIDTETAPSLATCVIKDHVVDLNGSPVENISVYARLLALPTNINGVSVRDLSASAATDENGFFQLQLIQGATVDITIPSTGFRRTLIVPSTTLANLFEIA